MVLVGISRTSKTPTLYLANRGFKTANFPSVPGGRAAAAVEAPGNVSRSVRGKRRTASPKSASTA